MHYRRLLLDFDAFDHNARLRGMRISSGRTIRTAATGVEAYQARHGRFEKVTVLEPVDDWRCDELQHDCHEQVQHGESTPAFLHRMVLHDGLYRSFRR